MTDQNILLQENGYPNAPDIKALRTVTYDPAAYKLVPVEPTTEMMDDAFENISLSDAHTTYGVTEHVWDYMLSKVSEQLEDVIEHSGEPVGWWHEEREDFVYVIDSDEIADGWVPVFTHPAQSQPIAAPTGFDAEFISKRLARVAALAGVPMPDMTHEQIAQAAGTILGQIAANLDKPAPPSDDEIHDAALEEAAKVCDCSSHRSDDMGGMLARNIRALKKGGPQ